MLIYFAIPKITYNEMSLKGFTDFSPAFGVEPVPFMLFTGYMELAIAALFVVGLLLLKVKPLLLPAANGLMLGTMLVGLYIEFFARTNPVHMLIIIALAFAAIAFVQMVRHLPVLGLERVAKVNA
jgi:hypothetical protein